MNLSAQTPSQNAQIPQNAQTLRISKRFSWQGKCAILCLCVLAFILIATPIFSPYDPNEVDIAQALAKPSAAHWFGCDHLGRDIFTRLVFGAYVSLGASFCILALVLVAGICIGAFSAMLGSALDRAVMRICDVFLSVPTMALALFFVGVLGNGLVNVIIAIALTHWAIYARIARSITLNLRHREYIAGAYMQGLSLWQNFARNILPTLLLQLLVLAAMDMGHIMLHIAGLSFIGLGVQPPLAEWGVMINDMKEYLYTAPHLLLYPGLALCFCVGIFTMLSDGLQRYFGVHLEDMKNG